MAPGPSMLQVKRGFVVIVCLVALGWCAELVRRDYYTQQENSLRQLMLEVGRTRTDPKLLDRRWKRLKARLHDSMEAAPTGELAVLAYRVAAPLKAEVSRAVRADAPVEVILRYGDEQLAEYLLPKEGRFRWEAEVSASWDSLPWTVIGQASWDEDDTSLVRVDIREVFPSGLFHASTHTLRMRALAHLYLPSGGGEPVHNEAVDLGTHVMRIGQVTPSAGSR